MFCSLLCLFRCKKWHNSYIFYSLHLCRYICAALISKFWCFFCRKICSNLFLCYVFDELSKLRTDCHRAKKIPSNVNSFSKKILKLFLAVKYVVKFEKFQIYRTNRFWLQFCRHWKVFFFFLFASFLFEALKWDNEVWFQVKITLAESFF